MKNWDIPYSSDEEIYRNLWENWNISDSSEKILCVGWKIVDGVLDASVWCPLRICVFEVVDVMRVEPQVSSEGETCITGDIGSIARS
jgi:hypothetical protein